MATTFLGQCFRLYSIKIKSINGKGVLDFIRKALFLNKLFLGSLNQAQVGIGVFLLHWNHTETKPTT